MMRWIVLIFVSFGAAAVLTAAAVHFSRPAPRTTFRLTSTPQGFSLLPVRVREVALPDRDVDHDGVSERFHLEDGRLEVFFSGGTTWKSPEGWQVDGSAVGDMDADGRMELGLTVWKSGNFGPSRPFWVTEDDPSVRNHFVLLEVSEGTARPRWMSSNLERPNCAVFFSDVDGAPGDELVVIEGAYGEDTSCRGEYVAVWRWNGWGFSNEWRSEPGNFVGFGHGPEGGVLVFGG